MRLALIAALVIAPNILRAEPVPTIELHAIYPFEPVSNHLGFPYIFHIAIPTSAVSPLNIDKLQFSFRTEDETWPSYCQVNTEFSAEVIRSKRYFYPQIRNIDDNKGFHLFKIGSHVAMPEEAKLLYPGETIDIEFLSDSPLGNGNTVGGKLCMSNIEKSIEVTILP